MRMGFWWLCTGIMLLVFLPAGLLLLAVVILKYMIILSYSPEEEYTKTKMEELVEDEYFENTLEKFR
jgi:hypothetical protein